MVTCTECGATRPAELAGEVERLPCPHCGATSVSIAVTLTESISVTSSVSYIARTTNTAATWRDALARAVSEVEAAVAAGQVHGAQQARKDALEEIHELSDCLSRGDWAQAGWTADDVAEWHAHIGARNAAHHTSSAISAIHSDGELEDRLRWDIDPEALATLRSQRQQRDYVSCLHGRAVLPALRALSQRVGRAVQ